MTEPSDVNLGSLIDEITLDVAEAHSSKTLEEAISDRALSHIRRMMDDGTVMDPHAATRYLSGRMFWFSRNLFSGSQRPFNSPSRR